MKEREEETEGMSEQGERGEKGQGRLGGGRKEGQRNIEKGARKRRKKSEQLSNDT